MAKKGSSKKSKLLEAQEQLEQAVASNAAKDVALDSLQQQLAAAQAQVQALQEDLHTNRQLELNSQELVARQREAACEHSDYENRVLILQLQSLVEKYRILDVEALSEQNHELREEVLRLQAENMEISTMLADSGQKARQDVARIHLALEATARETLASARQQLCAELHAQLDGGMRVLVEEHGQLQGSMVTLAEQAAELDKQYRCLVTDRRQFKIDAEVEQSMGDMQTRQIVLLKQQLDRMGLINQMLEVKVQEEVNRAEAAEARAATLSHTLARIQVQNQALRKLTAGLPAGGLDEENGELQIPDAEYQAEQLGQQLSAVQKQLDKACAGRDRWKAKANMYARAASQLQAALQALQHWGGLNSTITAPSQPPSYAHMKHIWSTDTEQAPAAILDDGTQQLDLADREPSILADVGTATDAAAAGSTPTGPPVTIEAMSTAGIRASSAHGRPPRPSPRAPPQSSLTPDPSRPSCTPSCAALTSLSAPTIPDFNTALPHPGGGAVIAARGTESGKKMQDSCPAASAHQAHGIDRWSLPASQPDVGNQVWQTAASVSINTSLQPGGKHTAALRPATAHMRSTGSTAGWRPSSAEVGGGWQRQKRQPLSAVEASAKAGLLHALSLVRVSRELRPSSGRAVSTRASHTSINCTQAGHGSSAKTGGWPTVQLVEGDIAVAGQADVQQPVQNAVMSRSLAAGMQDPFAAMPGALDRAGVMSHITPSRLHSAGPQAGRVKGQHQAGQLTMHGDVQGQGDVLSRPPSAVVPAAHRSTPPGLKLEPQAITAAAAALLGDQVVPSSRIRPHSALQPRAMRPGAVRYFGAAQHNPFLAMEAQLVATSN